MSQILQNSIFIAIINKLKDYDTKFIKSGNLTNSNSFNVYSSSNNTLLNQKNMTQEQTHLKIIFIGDNGVGKTSLLNRWHEDIFSTNYLTSIGIEYKIKTYHVGNLSAKVELQDTFGQERFMSLQKIYYKNSHVICLCFSLNNRKSFQNLTHRLKQIKNYSVNGQVYLFGCKSDLERKVQIHQILQFADVHNLTYFQTTAKYNAGVNDAFRKIVKDAVQANIMRMQLIGTKQNAKVKVRVSKDKGRGLTNKLRCNGS